MDILKINSAFMCGIASRILTKYVRKKINASIDIFPSDISIDMDASQTKVHLDIDLTMPTEEAIELVKKFST